LLRDEDFFEPAVARRRRALHDRRLQDGGLADDGKASAQYFAIALLASGEVLS